MKLRGLPNLKMFLETRKVRCSRRRGRNASNLWVAMMLRALARRGEADLLQTIDKLKATKSPNYDRATLEAAHRVVAHRADPRCPVCGKERCFNDPRKQRPASHNKQGVRNLNATYVS